MDNTVYVSGTIGMNEVTVDCRHSVVPDIKLLLLGWPVG